MGRWMDGYQTYLPPHPRTYISLGRTHSPDMPTPGTYRSLGRTHPQTCPSQTYPTPDISTPKKGHGTRHTHPLWTEWLTNACKNITFLQRMFRPVKNKASAVFVTRRKLALSVRFYVHYITCINGNYLLMYKNTGTNMDSSRMRTVRALVLFPRVCVASGEGWHLMVVWHLRGCDIWGGVTSEGVWH